MPLQEGGMVSFSTRGKDAHDAIYNKCQEMRRELRQIEQLIGSIERQARSKASFAIMEPAFSKMFNWYLSALESFFAITHAAFGYAKARDAIADFTRRFSLGVFSRNWR